ncbi:hypothetical protein [Endozoicomonas sp. YOMI1]|uniref:hypothetical protein n=1 Tax=Endozoicomonas sp. YOMI1 TaxID=2828739 RepID=UPI0021482EC2|nr:hypothetical protein [Endozoicomonas sp. YOMI1]
MDLYQLNGLTIQQLLTLIMESSIGFSAEDGSIQYLGWQIQLHDGITALSEQTFNTAGSKQLFERLVTIQPDLKTQLPGSKAEAIQMAASNLWNEFHCGAIEKSPTKEVQCAVFLECMRCVGPLKMVSELSETNSLTWTEKLRILLAADEKVEPLSELYWRFVGIPLSIRLEEAKNLFQRLPDTPSLAEKDNIINELLAAPPNKRVKDGLLEIRQIFKSENNELSRQLLSEVDNIEEEFMPRIDKDGLLPDFYNNKFETYTRRLLYLYAACSGFSQEADIAEVTSYIGSVLYTADSDSIWHIAKELHYLSKQPDSIDYCRYIHAAANILKVPATNGASNFEELKQLSDINGFALLESKKTLDPYLKTLRANIVNMTPAYSQVLLTEVDNLKLEFAAISLPEGKPDIKAKVHRLLLVIAACKSSRQIIDTSILDRFVKIIMEHGNKKNIPYLISGLARLVQSTPKIQQILGDPGIKGGKQLRLAPLQLLAFMPDIISADDFEKLNTSLQSSRDNRLLMKDGKVFHLWLATLEQVLNSNDMNKASVMQILKKLTQSLTYEKLGLLHMTLKMGDSLHKFLNSMDLSCQKEGLPLLIAEKGADAFVGKSKGVSQWLFEQRYFHLLPYYLAHMTKIRKTEITDLIHEFIKSSANNTFIENRQSPLNNPHLKAVYRKYPQFKAGWQVNFSDFSEATRHKLLSPGETLKLTEDPWDLFISGLEVNSCQSPEGYNSFNMALMSYVMDGRNAMIVRKNNKGNILSRSVIRMVLDQDDRPALFLEKGYPGASNLLFIDAAREIAKKMQLPLYHHVGCRKGEEVKLLEGRAPFDFFDSFKNIKNRQEVTLSDVQRDVK